jgi:hypothetical protein
LKQQTKSKKERMKGKMKRKEYRGQDILRQRKKSIIKSKEWTE